jgi:hypothetical protein
MTQLAGFMNVALLMTQFTHLHLISWRFSMNQLSPDIMAVYGSFCSHDAIALLMIQFAPDLIALVMTQFTPDFMALPKTNFF